MSDLLPEPGVVSRRTVAKGLAWTVPAVTLATAAPAMATSGSLVFSLGTAVKAPGNSCPPLRKGYGVPVTVSNQGAEDATIYKIVITLNSSPLTLTVNSDLLPVTVPAGETLVFWFNAQARNSANQVFNLGFDIYWRHGAADEDHEPTYMQLSIPGTPPGCDSIGG